MLVADFPADPLVGSFDEQLLGHIFGNLLTNAIKYSPQGGEVRFRFSAEGDAVVFHIIDQGIGIPPAEISHLFGSFHRASNVGNIQGTGLGLGLAIVQNSVDLHGGEISVHSTPGSGTTLSVRMREQA